jgi:hypothetical protein
MTQKAEVAERLTKVSDNYIRDVLKATNEAFAHDESLSGEQKRLFDQGLQDGVYYGTDIYADWAEWRELLTAEAQRRGLKV